MHEMRQLQVKVNDRPRKIAVVYLIVCKLKDDSSQNKFFILLFHSHIVKLFNMLHKQLLPSATKEDARNIQQNKDRWRYN